MSKILITSFEPFGLTGRFLRRANTAHDIATAIQQRQPDGDFAFLQLPVSPEAHDILAACLEREKPKAILGLGENLSIMPGHVNLEPYAYDSDVSLNPLAPTHKRERLTSAFVRQVAPHNHSTIGLYYCNAIYRQSLQWAKEQADKAQSPAEIPVAFMHVAVVGHRATQIAAVRTVLDQMQEALRAEGACSPSQNPSALKRAL